MKTIRNLLKLVLIPLPMAATVCMTIYLLLACDREERRELNRPRSLW